MNFEFFADLLFKIITLFAFGWITSYLATISRCISLIWIDLADLRRSTAVIQSDVRRSMSATVSISKVILSDGSSKQSSG